MEECKSARIGFMFGIPLVFEEAMRKYDAKNPWRTMAVALTVLLQLYATWMQTYDSFVAATPGPDRL
jgi:hypothetical protein